MLEDSSLLKILFLNSENTQVSSPVKFFMEWTSPVKKLSSIYMRLRVSSGMVI